MQTLLKPVVTAEQAWHLLEEKVKCRYKSVKVSGASERASERGERARKRAERARGSERARARAHGRAAVRRSTAQRIDALRCARTAPVWAAAPP
jgi:hypothetical protein